ncbi:putative membrane protein [Propionicimonas paludicola]|uniref:Putative membrane protein n=1 Tax=Propionicimonas paludicola TaxID=185243 RepID=A0A2A9CTN6_9ACTN|nr:DUF1304 domain-containing protein [Propionicimonas paludicola]PFG17425.1 putative membrane protein [Propionicimonas paludicola]
MLIAGLVLAALAAALHVFIFYLESVAWTSSRARATFGTTPEEAQVTKSMAFNQGFYNLFLALLAFGGIVAFAAGAVVVGLTLVFAGVGSMLAAALVLLVSSADHRAAAVKQGLLPLLAVVGLLIGLI